MSLFLNRSRHPPCSRSSVEQSRRVLTLWSWVRIPPGARDPHEYVNQFVPSCGSVEWWQSGRMRLSRKQQGRKPPEVRILPTPRTPHGNRSHEGFIEVWPVCPRTENTGMDGGPCGKGAVLLRLLGRKSLASSTLAPSASRSAVIGHGIGPGIQSAKRVGSAWRNAVGHTCPMRSRTFLLGVTAAHRSLEPIVLVRNQEEELSGSTSN